MRSNLCIIRGKAHIALEQRQPAKAQWIEALAADAKCVEGYELLQTHSLLTAEESTSLLQSLKYSKEETIIQEVLLCQTPANLKKKPMVARVIQAEKYYNQYNFQQCLQLTTNVLKEDPYDYGKVLLLHVASLVELRKKNELFLYAHQLSEALPSSSLSSFAIGSYYYCSGEYEKARTYFR